MSGIFYGAQPLRGDSAPSVARYAISTDSILICEVMLQPDAYQCRPQIDRASILDSALISSMMSTYAQSQPAVC